MIPYHRQEAERGPVLAWCPGPSAGRVGGFSALNISACPNGATGSSLSLVLETTPIPPRFYLSGRACSGILRRAERRGKTLPPLLVRALEASATEASPTAPSSLRERLAAQLAALGFSPPCSPETTEAEGIDSPDPS